MAVTSLPPRPQQRRPPRQTPDWVIDGLKAAVLANDEHAFKTLLSGQTRIRELSEVLYTALECDHAAAAFELVQRGFPITYGIAQQAVMSLAKKCLALFFDLGMDINSVPSRTETSVFAQAFPDRELVFWLLERGADLNIRPESTDITPLSYAVRLADPNLLQELLDRGSADVLKGDVLHYALKRETDVVAVLGMLLDKGAPLDVIEFGNHLGSFHLHFFLDRGTPLYNAAKMGNTGAVRFLLERGADARIPSSDGHTVLECAQQAGFTEIVKLLADKEQEIQGDGRS